MSNFMRRKAEAWLILLAAKILIGRNVQRAAVVSRPDNNDDMWSMSERLEDIAQRVSKNYPSPQSPCGRGAHPAGLASPSIDR